MTENGFTGAQKQYLEGLAIGLRLAHRRAEGNANPAPSPHASSAGGADRDFWQAQDRVTSAGQRLSIEERAKRRVLPEDLWPRLRQMARSDEFPRGDDVFLCKYQGLFYVSPVEEAYMCRLRFPAGVISAFQLRGLTELTRRHAHPLLQLTSRSNIQLRGVAASNTLAVLEGLLDLGIVARGSGADGVRNVCASPTAGFDRRELLDTRDLARQAHHLVLSDRSLQCLPRKVTLGFDGGGAVSAFAEASDIGFRAVEVGPGRGPAPGVYFRLLLGGATSHARLARDTGVIVEPRYAVEVLEQVLKLYVSHGDRTNRRRARLAYLIESRGQERFVADLRERLRRAGSCETLVPLAAEECDSAPPPEPLAHVGFHNQRPRGKSYVGVVVPSGRLSLEQASGLADIAERYGSGDLRLTLQQNVLVPGLTDTSLHRVKEELERLSLGWSASALSASLVACTGSEGCQFAVSNTKQRADELVRHLESSSGLTEPLSIRVSGCHHGCAQHMTADIGLLATRGLDGDRDVECYQVSVGGRTSGKVRLGQVVIPAVRAAQVPAAVERLIAAYRDRRQGDEAFGDFVARVSPPELRVWAGSELGGEADHG